MLVILGASFLGISNSTKVFLISFHPRTFNRRLKLGHSARQASPLPLRCGFFLKGRNQHKTRRYVRKCFGRTKHTSWEARTIPGTKMGHLRQRPASSSCSQASLCPLYGPPTSSPQSQTDTRVASSPATLPTTCMLCRPQRERARQGVDALLLGMVPTSWPVDRYFASAIHQTLGSCDSGSPDGGCIVKNPFCGRTVIPWRERRQKEGGFRRG